MTATTVFTLFEAVARRRGAAPFLHVLDETAAIYGIPSGDLSYGEIHTRAEGWAGAFRAAGYGPGHRVGLLLQNRPVLVELFLALNSLGVSIVPLNPDLRRAELSYQAEHSEMVLAIVLPDRLKEMQAAVSDAGLATRVITPDMPVPDAVTPADRAELGSLTECALLYTSGTTGRPKGCILPNEYFLNSADWYATTGGHISLRPDAERMLTPLPLFHMNALASSLMGMIAVGGCLTLLDRFHPRTWWDSVRNSRATVVHYLGVMPAMLMGAAPDATDRDHAVCFGFGAGVDQKLHAAFEDRFGFPLLEAWAMTETGNGGVISAHEEPRKIGTSCFGRPTPEVEVRIVDDSGADVADEMPGELLVRRAGADPTYGFAKGYLKNPEATAEAWAGGWFHTGDIVLRDADGLMHFVDRKKNVIRRSGENIAAVEVEAILNRHPEIAMAAVAAVPDEIRGDEVAALIRLEQGAGDAGKATELVAWALEQMAYYKVPGWVAFVSTLPLTATQKIQRGALKDVVSDTMAAGGFHDTRAQKKRQV